MNHLITVLCKSLSFDQTYDNTHWWDTQDTNILLAWTYEKTFWWGTLCSLPDYYNEAHCSAKKDIGMNIKRRCYIGHHSVSKSLVTTPMEETAVRNKWNANCLIMVLLGDAWWKNKEPYKYEPSDYSNEEICNVIQQMEYIQVKKPCDYWIMWLLKCGEISFTIPENVMCVITLLRSFPPWLYIHKRIWMKNHIVPKNKIMLAFCQSQLTRHNKCWW